MVKVMVEKNLHFRDSYLLQEKLCVNRCANFHRCARKVCSSCANFQVVFKKSLFKLCK